MHYYHAHIPIPNVPQTSLTWVDLHFCSERQGISTDDVYKVCCEKQDACVRGFAAKWGPDTAALARFASETAYCIALATLAGLPTKTLLPPDTDYASEAVYIRLAGGGELDFVRVERLSFIPLT